MILRFIKYLYSQLHDPVVPAVEEMEPIARAIGGMTPAEIKAELIRRGISMTEIAHETGTSVPEVSMCISGAKLYYKIRKHIARRPGRKITDVFAGDHPQPKSASWCKAA